jgi:predicted nuclease of predicted toxin-antitoxin system
MRLKLDENLPATLAEALRAQGHDADTVPEEALQGASDADVFSAAQAEGRFLITQDLDFADTRRYAPGTHHGILLVRLANPSRSLLRVYIERLFLEQDVEMWRGCFVVATDTKVRVRSPQAGAGGPSQT